MRRAGVAGVTVEITSDFPLGAGLGGSSAAGVAVNGALAAWRGGQLDRAALAEQSRAIEVEDLGVPGGRQDHYAAAYGGALALTFGDETRVRRLPLSRVAQGIARTTMHCRVHRCNRASPATRSPRCSTPIAIAIGACFTRSTA